MTLQRRELGRALDDCDPVALRLLLEQGASPETLFNRQHTCAMVAAELGFEEGLAILFEHGALLNARSTVGHTAAMLAAFYGHAGCLNFLLEHGADPHLAADQGMTCSMFAAAAGHLPCLEILARRGVDFLARRLDGSDAASLASRGEQDHCAMFIRSIQEQKELRDVARAAAPSKPALRM
jgi:ankyrin repeat protein